MRDGISSLRAYFAAKVGRCASCMRQSMPAALLAWGVFAAALAVGTDGPTQALIFPVALALSGLWLLHVAIYARRAVSSPAEPAPAERGVAQMGRRQAMASLLRAAGAGALASVPLVVWPSESFAFCGQCSKNSDCGVGYVCRNTAPVNSGKVCNECVKA